MIYFLVLNLVVVLAFIFFVNDTRIQLLIAQNSCEPKLLHSGLINKIQIILWMFIGGLWFVFYTIFDHLRDNYFINNVSTFKIITFLIIIVSLISIKYLFKRKILTDVY